MTNQHPLLSTLLEHWDGLRAGRRAPQRQDLRPDRLTASLIRRLVLMSVEDGGAAGPDFTCHIVGGAIQDSFSQFRSGQYLVAGEGPVSRATLAELQELCFDLRPRSYASTMSTHRLDALQVWMLALPLLGAGDDRRAGSVLMGVVAEPLRQSGAGLRGSAPLQLGC